MRAKTFLACTFLLISTMIAGGTTFKTLHSFDGYHDDSYPVPGVIIDPSGNLYGVAAWGNWYEGTIFELSPSGNDWTFHVLHHFDERDPEGAGPLGGLAIDEAGSIYGTASYDHGDYECGTVFTIDENGNFAVLHSFTGPDGCNPEARLTYSNGTIWGTTALGGANNQGTVFSMNTSGGSFQFKSFTKKEGTFPLSAVSLWGYGTTYKGGAKGQGNLYRLDPVKGMVNKHSFAADNKAGDLPMGDLLTLYVGGIRTIYGSNSYAGPSSGGSIYQFTETQPNSDRWQMRVLHSFSYSSDEGWAPNAGLIADASGNLYGTTNRGGPMDCGTVFRLSPGRYKNSKWVYTVLYSFDLDNGDGCSPSGNLVFDKSGNLYGTTQDGGEYYQGTVFELTP